MAVEGAMGINAPPKLERIGNFNIQPESANSPKSNMAQPNRVTTFE